MGNRTVVLEWGVGFMAQGKGKSKSRGITQRKDGRWQGSVTFGYTPAGKSDRRFVYGHTHDEAYRKRLNLLSLKSRGLPAPAHSMTVADFLAQWLEGTVKPSVRASTYRNYESACRVHLIPSLGKHPLVSLTPQHVQSFINRHDRKQAVRLRKLLVTALNQAVRWELVHRNVARLTVVGSPQDEASHRVRYLTEEQVRAFLGAVQGHRLEAFFTLLLTLGLRKGEALALCWHDLDLEARTLSVTKQVSGGVASPPKTRAGVRTIRVPAGLLPILRAHKERQAFERKRLAGIWRDNDLVFPGKTGQYQHPAVPNYAFSALLKKAGLPDFTIHALRHTSATLMLLQGVAPKVVSTILGHASITITLQLYAHVYDEQMEDAADRMGKRLFGG